MFSQIFHTKSKNHYSANLKTENLSLWPEEWKTTYYKKYTRFESHPLSQSEVLVAAELSNVLKTRESRRDFSGMSVSTAELSVWLKSVCGEVPRNKGMGKKRIYPSGGARYSIEHYIFLFQPADGLHTGIYHYRVDTHELELLEKRNWSSADFYTLASVDWLEKTSFLHVMSSVFWRSQNKYRERGYRLALLEAGHVGQNAYLVSEALGLKCCALSGIFDDTIETLLDIDGTTESLVHAVAVGR